MPRQNAEKAARYKDGEPIDPLLPDWLLPGWHYEYRDENGSTIRRGHDPVIVAPGTSVSRMEAIRLATDEAEGFFGSSPLWWRLGRWLFPPLWLAASFGLPIWLSVSHRTTFTWWQDREWLISVCLILLGLLVYYKALLPLARKQDERSRAGAFPTTGSMIAESSAPSTESRARFVTEDIAKAVRAIHPRAPQHDAELRTLVWEWSLSQDEATLSRIDRLWKRVDPKGFAKYEAEVAALWADVTPKNDRAR